MVDAGVPAVPPASDGAVGWSGGSVDNGIRNAASTQVDASAVEQARLLHAGARGPRQLPPVPAEAPVRALAQSLAAKSGCRRVLPPVSVMVQLLVAVLKLYIHIKYK